MRKKKEEPQVKFHEQIVTTGQLAAILGKTTRWVNELDREGVLKKESRGKFVLAQAVQDYIEHVLGGKEDSKKPKLIDFKTEHEKTRAEKAALELEQYKGNLHAAADVEVLLSDLILTTKSRLSGIPHRVGATCENETAEFITKEVTREIESALSGLARYTPDQIGGGGDGGSS
ncbi:hypothetical protein B2I21_08800 [Chryseobacterium mucoviscidosis]|nr:hypothetical protein B2I21_08800 [Chryseobacterium mucoviscidosis]